MSSTMAERDDMMDKSNKAVYHLLYTMYIMEDMIDFIKENNEKTIEQQMELLKKHRWLGTKDFLQLAEKWLRICKGEECCGNPFKCMGNCHG